MGDSQLGVDARVDECGVHPGQGQPVDDRRVHRTLQDNLRTEPAERKAGDQVALAGAVGQEPGALAAPGLGGEVGGLPEWGRCVAEVDALGEWGDVEFEDALAQEVGQARLGVGGRLMPRHVKA